MREKCKTEAERAEDMSDKERAEDMSDKERAGYVR